MVYKLIGGNIMLGLLFSFLGSIKTVLVGAVNWCVQTAGEMILSNIFGVQV